MNNKILPIGTVVLLNGGVKKLMIVGIKQADSEKPDITYDYSGVLYPEGYVGNKSFFLFNHSDINDIIYNGYVNNEFENFVKIIEDGNAKL